MNVEYFREYCLNKSNVSESMPFGDDVLVFKVFDKMFALLRMKENQESSVNLKCEPEKAIELREMYAAVKPGYHMHKKHWNTLFFNQDLKDEILLGLIDHSYNLIVDKLTKKQKQELH
ncbi:MAG: MmcQ/YjbR family DNA-binding protein [Lishizhenia sp.]